MKDIEKSFARAFYTNDGARVLMHLRNITIERFLGANATDSELRSLEAGRALVHQIETLIERGKNG